MVEGEGIRVFKGFYVQDLRRLEVGPWPRKGGFGCFVHLEGTEASNDSYVCEVPAGGQLNPEMRLFEELAYVLSGR